MFAFEEQTSIEADFIGSFNQVQKSAHENSKAHGFYDNGPVNNAEKIALMHSELSEALEALRHNNPPSDKVPEFSGTEEELADTIIRIMDFAELHGLRLAEAILAKHAYNVGRPYKHGGKAF